MKRFGIVMASLFGFVGVALGAFGAHGLKDVLEANGRLATWDTAVLYQFVHVGLILALAILDHLRPSRLLGIAQVLCVLGILIFSGSLYALSLTNIGWLGAITPLGGLAFLAAWTCLLLVAFQKSDRI